MLRVRHSFPTRRSSDLEIIANCHQCGKPADTHVNCVNDACHLLFIQCDECKEKYENCCSKECQEFIHLPEEQQKELRKGRSEEHTSELQSLAYLVCRLL